jgi:glutamate/tyrosine decarboxylase-like PLP-dependent enzyme
MLLLDNEKRSELWRQLIENVEDYINQIADSPVAPTIDLNKIRRRLGAFDFNQTVEPLAALQFAADNLREFQVHTPHPRYFGLFNPAPTAMGIAADALVAAFNPQLAAWSHNPFASEVERHLILNFAERFGYDLAEADGTFCSGGAEANHTALICALVRKFPDFAERGLRAIDKQPVFYVSAQSHHSFVKAARFCGLGTDAVREIKTDAEFKMSVTDLTKQIEIDRANNFAPFFVVATAGTTNGGVIDDLAAISEIAVKESLWFHTDAAWGGAAAFVPEMRKLLTGIEQADSITFDAHKWLSVPMGAGIFLTRHNQILSEACRITTDYMPRDASAFGVNDPFAHSMQWSRRFIGLKVFLSLAVAGWEGYAAAIRHQTAMGDFLRRALEKSDWEIVNDTPLPVVCFRDKKSGAGKTEDFLMKVANEAVSSGKAWISLTCLNAETPVLRACITNYRTAESDIRFLVRLIDDLRNNNIENQP